MGYGQYSERSAGRRTKDDLLRSAAFGWTDARLWGHNRLKVTYPDRVEYRLHDTAILTVKGNGEMIVDDGGYPTITTSAAIRQALAAATGKYTSYWRDRKHNGVVRFDGLERVGPLPLIIPAVARA